MKHSRMPIACCKKAMGLCVLFIAFFANAQQIDFDQYFENRTVGFEYWRVGCKQWDTIQPRYGSDDFWMKNSEWAGSKTNLVDPFNNGTFCVELREPKTDKVIYSKGFNTLFQEYCDTPEGDSVVARYEEVVLFPKPKVKVEVVLRRRDADLKLQDQKRFVYDPSNHYEYSQVSSVLPEVHKVHYVGDVHHKMDVVIIGQGYEADNEKLQQDLAMFKDNLFAVEPFRSHQADINVWGIAGNVGAEYNTFGADRYCMTHHVWDLYHALDHVAFDHIIIMVNSDKYGGGAIYNFYAVSSVHGMCGKIMPHELGHSIGGLADEYVDENLSYGDIHRRDIEPLEPNITTLVDFDSKWKSMLPEGTPIPTEPMKKLRPKECGPLGVYEGAGYQKKGIYRPVTNCMMNYYADFCPVCSRRLEEVIGLYCR